MAAGATGRHQARVAGGAVGHVQQGACVVHVIRSDGQARDWEGSY